MQNDANGAHCFPQISGFIADSKRVRSAVYDTAQVYTQIVS